MNVEDITNALNITEINIPWHVTIPKVGFRIYIQIGSFSNQIGVI